MTWKWVCVFLALAVITLGQTTPFTPTTTVANTTDTPTPNTTETTAPNTTTTTASPTTTTTPNTTTTTTHAPSTTPTPASTTTTPPPTHSPTTTPSPTLPLGQVNLTSLRFSGPTIVNVPVNLTLSFSCDQNCSAPLSGKATVKYDGGKVTADVNNITHDATVSLQFHESGLQKNLEVDFGDNPSYAPNTWDYNVDVLPVNTSVDLSYQFSAGNQQFFFAAEIKQNYEGGGVNGTFVSLFINDIFTANISVIPLCPTSDSSYIEPDGICRHGIARSDVYTLEGLSSAYAIYYQNATQTYQSVTVVVDGCNNLDCGPCVAAGCGWCQNPNIDYAFQCVLRKDFNVCGGVWFDDYCPPSPQSFHDYVIVACVLGILFGCLCLGLGTWFFCHKYYHPVRVAADS